MSQLASRREQIAAKDHSKNPYTKEILDYQDFIWLEAPQQTPEREAFLEPSAPWVADLGCGSGNFLRHWAQREPQTRFVGFELRYKRLVLGARKLRKWGIDNVRMAQARAEEIEQWFGAESLTRVHVNFPDPWPKKRHRKNRLIQEPWLEKLNQVLRSDGQFWFKTDHREYFESSLELIERTPHFEVDQLSWDLHNSEYAAENILTEFEMLFRSKGLPVYHLTARPLR